MQVHRGHNESGVLIELSRDGFCALDHRQDRWPFIGTGRTVPLILRSSVALLRMNPNSHPPHYRCLAQSGIALFYLHNHIDQT
jgi:hypothetical protein